MDRRIKKVLLAIATSSLAASIYAAAPGSYFGLDFGVSNSHNKNQTLLTGTGYGTMSAPGVPASVDATPSNKALALRMFFGYNFNKFAGFEGGFDHYGNTTFSNVSYVTTVPAMPGNPPNNPMNVNLNLGIKDYGFDLEFKGMLPVGESFNAFIKAGFGYIRQTQSGSLQSCGSTSAPLPCSTVTGVNTGSTSNAFRPLIGFGMAYDFSQNWEGDASFTRITKGNGIQNMDFFGVGFAYHFVADYCGQFLC
jgi:hypothetical protein